MLNIKLWMIWALNMWMMLIFKCLWIKHQQVIHFLWKKSIMQTNRLFKALEATNWCGQTGYFDGQ